MPSDNPLLSLGFEVPFDRISAEHVEPAIHVLLERARKKLEEIETGAVLDYESVLGRLDRATEPLDVAMTVVGHLEAVANTPELRAAHNAVRPEVNAFYAGIPLRPKLWETIKAYSETEDARALSGARRRFLKKTIDDFKRQGADLDPAGKRRLEDISRKLAELTSRFAQNVLDSTARFELLLDRREDLAGLPDSAVAGARQDAEQKGKPGYRFTLQAPSYIPLVTYLDDRRVREIVYRAYNARGTSNGLDNAPIIAEILELRREQAKILGYEDFANFVLEDRMAKTGARARSFVLDLTARTETAFASETEALIAFQRELAGPDAPPLEPWDVAYYSEKQRRRLYAFDEEELRPYFSLDRVVSGLFETVRRLYGVKVEPNTKLPTWHPDVAAYDLRDEDGAFLGSFYADFFPREEKRGGAWMNALVTGTSTPSGRTPHLGLIATNVSPRVGGRPALLTHQEVTTLFHEFGHLMHHLLSRVSVRSLSGTNVAWDFVELPSQIMENWCWERAALDTFARHVDTNEPIPDSLFEKMQRARTYREASAMMRQLGFAAVDLALHVDYVPARDGEVVAYARRVMQKYAPARFDEDYAMIASFTHLFASAVGYAAGYYSYKWAEVLDADAFTRFRAAGVFSRDVGGEFRRTILERGDSDDPLDLYRAFMGRDPSLDALLARSGLSKAAA